MGIEMCFCVWMKTAKFQYLISVCSSKAKKQLSILTYSKLYLYLISIESASNYSVKSVKHGLFLDVYLHILSPK